MVKGQASKGITNTNWPKGSNSDDSTMSDVKWLD